VGLRDTLNRNPSIATGITLAAIVLVVAFIIYSQSQSSPSGKEPTKAFYTTDEGKHWFVDDIGKLPPFDHDGKEAVRAVLFRCGNGDPFVGYLERYTAETRQQLEDARSGSTGTKSPQYMRSLVIAEKMGKELKKPGDTQWIRLLDEQNRSRVLQIKCPEGQSGVPVPVTP
jgi:hypothetical protein